MLNFFRRSGKVTEFQQRVAGYHSYSAPHAGVMPANLTATQAEENLQYLLQQRQSRIATLAALLHADGINLTQSLDVGDPEAVITQLHRWAGDKWPECQNPENANRNHWLNVTDRSGADNIYSVVMDTAIALGELLIKHNPAFSWQVDLDAENRKDGMLTVNRCVLYAASQPTVSAPHTLDIEQVVAERYYDAGNIRQSSDNTWLQQLRPLMEKSVTV